MLQPMCIAGGFLGITEVFSPNAHWLEPFFSPVFVTSTSIKEVVHPEHSIEYRLMAVSVGLAVIAILIALFRFSKKPELNEPKGFGKVLADKWYIDELYNLVIVRPLQW